MKSVNAIFDHRIFSATVQGGIYPTREEFCIEGYLRDDLTTQIATREYVTGRGYNFEMQLMRIEEDASSAAVLDAMIKYRMVPCTGLELEMAARRHPNLRGDYRIVAHGSIVNAPSIFDLKLMALARANEMVDIIHLPTYERKLEEFYTEKIWKAEEVRFAVLPTKIKPFRSANAN